MFFVFFIKYPLTPLDIPTPEINKVIRPTKDMNRVVLSMKLLKLFVLFLTVFMKIFVPSINLFKEDNEVYITFYGNKNQKVNINDCKGHYKLVKIHGGSDDFEEPLDYMEGR